MFIEIFSIGDTVVYYGEKHIISEYTYLKDGSLGYNMLFCKGGDYLPTKTKSLRMVLTEKKLGL